MDKARQPIRTGVADIAFLILFAAEFTYYLLILQTGVVEYHHSIISEIWMVPVGGILGIVLSVALFYKREALMPWLLFLQLLLSFAYAEANGMALFLLGLISGLTAPMLLYRIDKLYIATIALGVSYFIGTMFFDIPAHERTTVAVALSVAALAGSFFAQTGRKKTVLRQTVSIYMILTVFLWLLLDAALFETLSRDTLMHLWGCDTYRWHIILFHSLGLLAAYALRRWRHTDVAMIVLFLLAYTAYSMHNREMLSIVYPFVISYYNVAILYRLMHLGYLPLAVVSLGLWGASGLGLFIALLQVFTAAWIMLALLAVVVLFKALHTRLFFTAIHFTSLKG